MNVRGIINFSPDFECGSHACVLYTRVLPPSAETHQITCKLYYLLVDPTRIYSLQTTLRLHSDPNTADHINRLLNSLLCSLMRSSFYPIPCLLKCNPAIENLTKIYRSQSAGKFLSRWCYWMDLQNEERSLKKAIFRLSLPVRASKHNVCYQLHDFVISHGRVRIMFHCDTSSPNM